MPLPTDGARKPTKTRKTNKSQQKLFFKKKQEHHQHQHQQQHQQQQRHQPTTTTDMSTESSCLRRILNVSMASGQPSAACDSSARQRRERRLRSMLRHERQTVTTALAEASHHSGLRAQKTASAQVDPTCVDLFERPYVVRPQKRDQQRLCCTWWNSWWVQSGSLSLCRRW